MRRHLLAIFCATLSLGGLAMDAGAAGKSAATIRAAAPTPTRARKVASQDQYSKRVSSATPLFVGLVRDESGSNRHPIGGTDVPMSKADAIADAINKNLEAIVSHSADGITEGTDTEAPTQRFKGWFKVVGVGYSTGTRPLFGDSIKMMSTTELAHSARWFDGNGKPVDGNSKQEDWQRMRWVDPKHEGATHMAEGLAEILPHLSAFVAEHPDARAPVIMHLTDGKPEGGSENPIKVADAIKGVRTKDGHALLFNIHVGEQGETFMFPNQARIDQLTGELKVNAQRMFDMSSPMPPSMLTKARTEFSEYRIPDGARTMVYNANGAVLTKLIEMGTVQNMGK